jgi:hypothetical protein
VAKGRASGYDSLPFHAPGIPYERALFKKQLIRLVHPQTLTLVPGRGHRYQPRNLENFRASQARAMSQEPDQQRLRGARPWRISSLPVSMRAYWCIVSISWEARGCRHLPCQLESPCHRWRMRRVTRLDGPAPLPYMVEHLAACTGPHVTTKVRVRKAAVAGIECVMDYPPNMP